MQVDATIILWGDSLVPEEVSASLGTSSTHAVKKGDRLSFNSKNETVAKTGRWSICTKHLVQSDILADHLNFLLSNQIINGINSLKKFNKIDKIRLSIIISIEEGVDGKTWEEELDSTTVSLISDAGMSLSFVVLFS